jgi:TRAP-type C4-dicarboxylate transport system permease small subunit
MSHLEDACLSIAAIVMICIMIVVSLDAIFRYAFNSPISWAYDVIALYGLVLIGYLPLAATFREGGHVSVSLFYHTFSTRAQLIIRIVVALLNLAFCAFIFVLSLNHTIKAYEDVEVRMGVMIFLIWPSYLPIAVGFFMIVARLCLSVLMLVTHGRDPFVQLDGEVLE